MNTLSTKPYLIRALWQWCIDQGQTPQIVVTVDEHTQVPAGYVKDGQIVLNIGLEATNQLDIGNEFIAFQARFGGVAQQIFVPIERVAAIFARESNEGMGFEVAETQARTQTDAAPVTSGLKPVDGSGSESASGTPPTEPDPPSVPPNAPGGGRPRFTVVK